MAKTPTRQELDCLSPFAWVQEERRRQTVARGEQNHNPLRWFCTLAEEFGEVAKVINDRMEGKLTHGVYADELEYELIQTAAVAVAFVEALRRGKHTSTAPMCTCRDCAAEILQNPGVQETLC